MVNDESVIRSRERELIQGKRTKNMKSYYNTVLINIGLALIFISPVTAELLTAANLHSQAFWGGSSRDYHMQAAQVATLHDGDTATSWTRTTGGGSHIWATPTLTSPRPFIVTKIEVVASTGTPSKSGGNIEILKVGASGFIAATNVIVPTTLASGELWSMDMPIADQVPISAIRHHGYVWDNEMMELRFYGDPVECSGGNIIDLTSTGTVQTSPTSESPAGSLTNGVLEDDTSGLTGGAGGTKTVVIDFGAGVRKEVLYTAWNPNNTWGVSFTSTAVGTSGDYALGSLIDFSAATTPNYTGSLSRGEDAPGHVWVVTAVNDGAPRWLGSAGYKLSTSWNYGASEIVVLGLPPKGSVISIR